VENFDKKCLTLSKKNQKSQFKHFRFDISKSPLKRLSLLLAHQLKFWLVRSGFWLRGVVYRPPASGFVFLFLDCLSEFCPGYYYTILIGGFNINQQTNSLEKRELHDIFDVYSFIHMGSTHHQP
jgi:hypothetical protein